MVQECVGEDDELSHDGCDGDFGRLSGGDEGLILGFYVGVEADGDQCGHVEGLPEMGASGADEALAAVLS